MKKTIMIIILILTMLLLPAPAHANNTDLNIAEAWINNHYSMHTVKVVNRGNVGNENNTIYIERVKTKAVSKIKGKIIGTNDTIKYPQKVKKSKMYVVYRVYNDFELIAIVCAGKIKSMYKDAKINCPNCNGYDRDCPYWIYNENKHMTEEEIVDFEFWEGHYIDEEGNVCEF